MNILLFGAPGVGKGTQSQLLVEKLDMKHISTGDLFRNAIKKQTDLGQEAQKYMDKGELVPDSIVIGMVEEVLKSLDGHSFILDGFPRTRAQAEALDQLLASMSLSIEKVISLDVPQEELLKRLTGRRVCKACGAVYHETSNPTKEDGVCDVCGGEVVQRNDDKEEAIQKRLSVYEDSTAPVKDFYKSKEKLVDLDGMGDTSEVFERIKSVLR
ncbi:MAG: adenylate kinase [Bdellovibrionales bacterium]|nr:adenylate kinase [Bdellovibrionales bacterium]